MTPDELLARLNIQIASSKAIGCECSACDNAIALRAVIELHKDENGWCLICNYPYPCPTIQAIEKELQ
jgi:hypothetical protein